MFNAVKIIGERNSGTNFVEAFIGLNFNCKIYENERGLTPAQESYVRAAQDGHAKQLPLIEAILDHNHFHNLPSSGGWKHAAITERYVNTFARPKNVLTIIVLRHPAAWVMSMHRMPFHTMSKVPKDLSEFIRVPWLCRSRDELADPFVADLPSLLSAKTKSYCDFIEMEMPHILLRYEDVVLNPNEMADLLCNHLERKRDDLQIPNTSVRKIDRGKGSFEQFKQKAQNTSYASLSVNDRQFVLDRLRSSILTQLYPN